uniref:NIF3-like protein 1 n=1 Tax=Phallusia mammillata TaxID=59560 RepID=A0A6F9DLK8_9ASCI|nr:putative GTP cyclohydrolase 1 type 2 NIF3L1 [Phallusia mammillata]
MNLNAVVSVLDNIAPTKHAAGWDNVGLLVEPTQPHIIKKIMLTNDLTPTVMEECVVESVNMVISYHPPIFNALKRLTSSSWKEKVIVTAIENRIAVYSPHTAWDAIDGGVNDWLSKCLGDLEFSKPLQCNEITLKTSLSFDIDLSVPIDVAFTNELKELFTVTQDIIGENLARLTVTLNESDQQKITSLGKKFSQDIQFWRGTPAIKLPLPNIGSGRLCKLASPATISSLIENIKSYLGISHVRLALAEGSSIVKTVALCAGAGSSVLKGVKADLYLTGEMSHHDVLDAVCNGTSVVLCEHTNTERGFLKVMSDQLSILKDINVIISKKDEDPLKVY